MKSFLLLFMAMVVLVPARAAAATREVVVYSFVTDAGREVAPSTAARPARCRLGSGGYHEWGGIRAGEKPATLEQIDPLVRTPARSPWSAHGRAGNRQPYTLCSFDCIVSALAKEGQSFHTLNS